MLTKPDIPMLKSNDCCLTQMPVCLSGLGMVLVMKV